MEDFIKYSHVEYPKEKSFYYDHVHISYDEQIGFHQQKDWEISYIIKGSGTRLIGDVMEPFNKGEVVLIPPDLPHGWRFTDLDYDEEGKIENITVIFPDSLLISLADSFLEMIHHIRAFRQIQEALTFEGETKRHLQDLLLQMKDQNDLEQLSAFMFIIFKIAKSTDTRVVGYSKKQTKSTVKLREIYRYIIHNYQDNITLDTVSKYFGMNRSSFCSFYKRETGKTFVSALNEYRVNCSCMMLRETQKSISEICYVVGFNNIPHFCRTFRKINGKSPREYRDSVNTLEFQLTR